MQPMPYLSSSRPAMNNTRHVTHNPTPQAANDSSTRATQRATWGPHNHTTSDRQNAKTHFSAGHSGRHNSTGERQEAKTIFSTPVSVPPPTPMNAQTPPSVMNNSTHLTAEDSLDVATPSTPQQITHSTPDDPYGRTHTHTTA